MREQVSRKQGVKIFSVGDEILLHAFKAHLVARICTILKVTSTSSPIEHDVSSEWLRTTAERPVVQTLMPYSSTDPPPHFPSHCVFVYWPAYGNPVWERTTHNKTLETMASHANWHRVPQLCYWVHTFACQPQCHIPKAHCIHSHSQQNCKQ